MFKLYELADKYNQVAEMLENGIEGLDDTLSSIEDSFKDKAENIVKLMRHKVSEQEMIDNEIARLKGRSDKLKKDAEWLRNYVEREMLRTGITKVPSSLFSITIANNTPKIEVFDETLIPSDYIRTVTSPDKIAIRDAINNGVEVPGANLVQTKSLRIK